MQNARRVAVVWMVLIASGCQAVSALRDVRSLVVASPLSEPGATPTADVSSPPGASDGFERVADTRSAITTLLLRETGHSCYMAGHGTPMIEYQNALVARARRVAGTETWVESGPEWDSIPRAGWLGSLRGLAHATGARIGVVGESDAWIIRSAQRSQFDGVPPGTPVAFEFLRKDLGTRTLWLDTGNVVAAKPCDEDLE